MTGKAQYVGLIAVAALCSSLCMASAKNRLFASPMGKEEWTMSGNRLRCGLSLGIPAYGVAYFEQYATREPHFILHKYQQVERRLPATVTARPPVWKPGQSSWFIAKTHVKPGKYGLFLEREPALKALNYLANGLQTVFNYRSEQGFGVDVVISPIRFQDVYRKYQRCVGNLLPFNYDDVKESIFYFAVDEAEINPNDKAQLNRIALYSRVDRSLKEIRISGYTDDVGRKSYNNAVSELRAKSVERYLKSQRVRQNLLSVTWYGVKHPADSNATEAGRAANRRVVVELIR